MKIDDYQDYLLVASPCCCLPKDCLTDVWFHYTFKLLHFNGTASGYLEDGVPDVYNISQTVTCPSNSESVTNSLNTYYAVELNDEVIPPEQEETITGEFTEGCDDDLETTYSGPISATDAMDGLREIYESNIDFGSDNVIEFEQEILFGLPQSDESASFTANSVQLIQNRYQYGWILDDGRPDVKWFKLEWDEYWVHPDYNIWVAEYMEWLAVQDTHDEWEECQALFPGECGPEPPHEGPEPERPATATTELVAHRSYEYGGSNPQSSYYDVPLKMIGDERNFIIANMRFHCYRSAQLGSVPALMFEQIF